VLRWIGTGLLAVLVTGLGSLIWGYPFLTSHSAHPALPWVGQIHVPSATFFDAGVFAVVVGSVLLILVALAHQSLRGQRAESAGGTFKPKATLNKSAPAAKDCPKGAS